MTRTVLTLAALWTTFRAPDKNGIVSITTISTHINISKDSRLCRDYTEYML